MSSKSEVESASGPSQEPDSSLSVIPEATEENRGSSFFMFRARGSKVEVEAKRDSVPLVESVAGVPTKHSSNSRDGEINEFRAVMLVGKQPYSSCCCLIF